MKSTVEQISPTRVKINVEVPFDELKSNFDRAYRKIAKQVRIPGFRPGKAPARVLESRIGRAPVLDEVVNEVIPAKYLEAVRGTELRALGQPEFEVTKLEDHKVLEFSAEVDIRPEITLPELKGLEISVDDVELTDDEVTEQLDELRARFGTLTGVQRPAKTGDFVSVDLSATVDGELVEEASTTGLSYEIGSGQLVDGIDEAIVGVEAGETKAFTTKLVAGEYIGRDAEVSVTVQTIKQRELPELDDEFAQLASEFDSLDELKADLRERLGRVKKMQQGVQARDKILEILLSTTEVPLPERIVQGEIDTRKHDAIHQFDHDEAAFSKALEAEGKTLEGFEAEIKEEAEKAVRTQLLLDTIADVEKTSVNDGELTERIVYQAQRFGISPEEYVQRAQQSGQLSAIFADVRRGKALASVVRRAKVTDASGAEIALEDLFGKDEAEVSEQIEVSEATEVPEAIETSAAPEADSAEEAKPVKAKPAKAAAPAKAKAVKAAKPAKSAETADSAETGETPAAAEPKAPAAKKAKTVEK